MRAGVWESARVDRHTAPRWESSALLTLGLQVDTLDGPHADEDAEQAATVAARLLASYRRAQLPVVHAVRLHPRASADTDPILRGLLDAGAVLCEPDTPGSQIAAELLPPSAPPLDPRALLAGQLQRLGRNEYAVRQPRFDAFFRTALDEHLLRRGVDTVVVAGAGFGGAGRATLYGAVQRDYRAVAVSDALSGWTSPAAGDLAGIGIATVTTDDVVTAVAAARL